MIQKRPAVVTSSIASSVAGNHRPARPHENRVASLPYHHRDFLSYLLRLRRVTGLPICSLWMWELSKPEVGTIVVAVASLENRWWGFAQYVDRGRSGARREYLYDRNVEINEAVIYSRACRSR